MQESSRRQALSGIAAAGAALVPVAANAAAGESPRFSVFGLIGDGGAYSEGAAYGSDQEGKLYSPYSVYGEAGKDSLYKAGSDEYVARKKAVVEETKKRMAKLPTYVEKKQWFNVTDELSRFMYETRSSINYLSTTPEQKKAAKAFYVAIEAIGNNARLKRAAPCTAAIDDAIAKLNAMSF